MSNTVIADVPGTTREDFGVTKDGQKASLYTLVNDNGMIVKVSDYGATIQSILVPTKSGLVDVCLGYDDVSGYEQKLGYIGALVGRVANRIGNARFAIDGVDCELLDANKPPNHIHGGVSGFSHNMWKLEFLTPFSVTLSYVSPDGDQGYPGEVKVEVSYTLTTDNAVQLRAVANSTKATPVMLTSHAYFNLNGHDNGTIAGHHVQLLLGKCCVTDANNLVTGETFDVSTNPAYDLRKGQVLNEPLQAIGNFDNYYFKDHLKKKKETIAIVKAASGIRMQVDTTELGAQFYTGGHLREQEGKGGAKYGKYSGLCIETHGFPDAVNHPEWPTHVLYPGETYDETTLYRFFVDQ